VRSWSLLSDIRDGLHALADPVVFADDATSTVVDQAIANGIACVAPQARVPGALDGKRRRIDPSAQERPVVRNGHELLDTALIDFAVRPEQRHEEVRQDLQDAVAGRTKGTVRTSRRNLLEDLRPVADDQSAVAPKRA
jgi:hypothetical protein